ncbi:MAG: Mut7-C RNAse domain-containing protein [Candidatus Thorarchaeota archaeon]
MRFIVDGMLGKAAIWLRLTGHDTTYYPDADDDVLLETARDEGRILLTSDARLHLRAETYGVVSALVRGDVDEQIAAIFVMFGIEPEIDPARSRCSKCNGILVEVRDKDDLRNLVHERTLAHYDRFWLCTECRSVYFQGGQWRNMNEYMDRLRTMIRHSERHISPGQLPEHRCGT